MPEANAEAFSKAGSSSAFQLLAARACSANSFGVRYPKAHSSHTAWAGRQVFISQLDAGRVIGHEWVQNESLCLNIHLSQTEAASNLRRRTGCFGVIGLATA
jgi:hypothetical protein